MFGNKLRSWMEAVRPKKKQQRKEKQPKSTGKHPNPACKEQDANVDRRSVETLANTCVQNSRYSGTNLSSPESAYSTGYSTDGTSPGAPPEYYINIKTGTRCPPPPNQVPENRQSLSGKHTSRGSPCFRENSPRFLSSSRAKTSSYADLSSSAREKERLPTVAIRYDGDRTTVSMDYDASANGSTSRTSVTLQRSANSAVPPHLTEVIVNSSITSPRQRNRIRTNPWLPGSTLSPGNSSNGLQRDHFLRSNWTNGNSPVSLRHLSPNVPCSPANRPNRRNSLSSSSCSSLSGAGIHYDPTVVRKSPRNNNSGSDDDCTLNEMMGKYDESYVYEKETDILSDSDQTDCETDIDTGQDGGDEEDPVECEFDFIDNGSYLEFNIDGKEERNSGHCTYYNFEIQRTSRRRTTRRSHKQDASVHERRRRSSSLKKKPKQMEHPHPNKIKAQLVKNCPVDGSRSAGATPLSARRSILPMSKLAVDERLRKRSNSVSFSQNPTSTFDRRDKEAEKKYKELIVEAEHILMSMKTNGLSPRRLPGPPNKRVELLKNTECSKPDSSRIPSNNFNSPRFSPKKNHITNFISHNSPVIPKRETSPLVEVPRSPRYKKKSLKNSSNQSSSSESDEPKNSSAGFGCPQSEPVRRKVYGKKNKNVAFNLNYETVCNGRGSFQVADRASAENLRQQVLLNTIVNLKRSLEDQSASLKQVYKGSKIHDD